MGRQTRPILAAVLALAVAGLGHAYLRRWARAAGWFALIIGSGIALVGLFADPATEVQDLPPRVIYPLVGLFALSAIDAYRIASRQNAEVDAAAEDGDEAERCPNCGKELDAGVDFCPWCAHELSSPPDEEESEDAEASDETAETGRVR